PLGGHPWYLAAMAVAAVGLVVGGVTMLVQGNGAPSQQVPSNCGLINCGAILPAPTLSTQSHIRKAQIPPSRPPLAPAQSAPPPRPPPGPGAATAPAATHAFADPHTAAGRDHDLRVRQRPARFRPFPGPADPCEQWQQPGLRLDRAADAAWGRCLLGEDTKLVGRGSL